MRHGESAAGCLPDERLHARARLDGRTGCASVGGFEGYALHDSASLADLWRSGQVAICHLGGLTTGVERPYTRSRVRSIVSMSPNGRVTLPAETRRALGLEGESFFEVQQKGSAIVLRPVAMVPLEKARSKASRTKAR